MSGKSKKIIKLSLIIFIVLLFVSYGIYRVSKLRNFQFFGGLTSRVNTQEKIIALTFDDAPTEHTEEVIKILAQEDVPATFYAIGQNLEMYPQQGKFIVVAGHELGNHSYSHHRMVFKSPGFVKDEIEKTDQLIRDAGYTGEITFRPPNGKKLLVLPWYLNRTNRKTIMWDIEPESYPDIAASRQKITDYVIENARPGSIILLHPLANSTQKTRDALPQIIKGLKDQGYRFVTVSELLEAGK